MIRKVAIENLGWVGAGCLVVAYTALSLSWLTSTDVVYQLLNALGAIGIIIVSWSKRTYQPMVVNVLWLAVACIALVRMFVG